MNVLKTLVGAAPERIQTLRLQILVTGQVVWMIIILLVLDELDALTVENAYVLSYLGLVIITQLLAPVRSTPRWWRAIKWLVRLGFLGLCFFVGREIMAVTTF
jgi:hypothetical protein